MENPEQLREYLSVLRRRRWTVIVLTAVTFLSAMAFSLRQTPIYEATAKVQVKPPTTNQLLQNLPVTTLVSMDTEREVVRSIAVAKIAAETLGGDPAALAEKVSVGIPTGTQILEITYADPDAGVAQAGADAFADAYLEYKTRDSLDAYTRVRTGIQRQIEDLQRKLDEAATALEATGVNSPEHDQIQNEINLYTSQIAIYRNQFGTLSVLDIDPGSVIAPADLPASPASPNLPLNGALALVVGLALGVGLAFLRERLDDRIEGREAFEAAVGAPVLAIVPTIPGWRKREDIMVPALSDPKGGVAEAYRTVRTNLQFITRDGGSKVLVFTSAAAGEGKTTTTANLAVTLAQAGRRVVVVSCDLRKPRLHRFFGLHNEHGTTDVLIGASDLVEVAQRVAGVDTLRVLSSGRTPPNPTELLDSPEMDRLLEGLRRFADFILLDTPPVLAVADTLAVSARADGVILVADASATARSAVQHAREQLEQIGAKVLGGILNNFDPSQAKYYPSYYRYYYSYRYKTEPSAQRAAPDGLDVSHRDPEEMWS